MRPQASRQRPRSATAPPPLAPRSLHPPHPSVLPPLLFRHSPVPSFSAQAGIHATSSFPSAPQISDGPPPLAPRFPSPTPPPGLAPRSCPSFPSFPCSSQGQALRRQESMRPQASRQRPRSATAPTTRATLPSPTPPPVLSPVRRHSGTLRRQESMRPQASRKRISEARRHSTHPSSCPDSPCEHVAPPARGG